MDRRSGRPAESLHLADNLGRFSTLACRKLAFWKLPASVGCTKFDQLREDKRNTAIEIR
jgi:hypothetical protein